MISVEKIKSMIMHTDWEIHENVMKYIARARIISPSIFPTILNAVFLDGKAEDDIRFDLVYCEHFSVDYETAETIFKIIDKYSYDEIDDILYLCRKAPLDFLNDYCEKIKALECDDTCLEVIKIRNQFEAASAKDVWEKLISLTNVPMVDNICFPVCFALTRILADMQYPDEQSVIDVLIEENTVGQWLEIFLFELAGERQIEGAVEMLLDLIRHEENEFLSTIGATCLSKYNSDDVIQSVADIFWGQGFIIQISLCAYFAKMPCKKCESVVIELLHLRSVYSTDIVPALYFAMCDIFSPEAFVWGPKLVNDDTVSNHSGIKEKLIEMADALETNFPEKSLWESQLEEACLLEEDGPLIFPKITIDDDYTPSSTIITSDKVGRNESCPCGSGKKFKKCCL